MFFLPGIQNRRRYEIFQENCVIFLTYIDRKWEYVWEWILRMWDDVGRNINLDEAKIIKKWLTKQNSEFSVSAWGVRKSSVWLIDWNMDQSSPMPEPRWYVTEGGIQRFRDIKMLTWIDHVNPAHPPWDSWERPKNTSFNHDCEKQIWEGSPSILE